MHDVTPHLGPDVGGVGVVERHQLRAPDEEMGGVHESPAEVTRAHDHHVVVQVVPQRVTDSLAEHARVVAGAARTQRSEPRQIAAHRGGGHASQLANLLGVDAVEPAR